MSSVSAGIAFLCAPRAGETGSQFTYTIGLSKTFGHPEITIFGLDSKVSHEILSDCVEMIRNGTAFLPDVKYPGVVGADYKVMFKAVRKDCLPEYFGAAVRFYGNGTNNTCPSSPAAVECAHHALT